MAALMARCFNCHWRYKHQYLLRARFLAGRAVEIFSEDVFVRDAAFCDLLVCRFVAISSAPACINDGINDGTCFGA